MTAAAEIVELVRRHYAGPMPDAPDEEYSIDAVLNWLAKLSLSHTVYLQPDDIDYYHLLDVYSLIPGFRRSVSSIFPGGVRYRGIGVVARREEDGRWFVHAVHDGGPAAKAGLLAGDELVGVDGIPFHPVSSFSHPKPGRRIVGVRRRQHECVLKLPVHVMDIRPSHFLREATRLSARRLSDRDGRPVGYIRAWTLVGEGAWQNFTSIIASRFEEVDRLIVDLREGTGGVSPDRADFFVGVSPELCYRDRNGVETIINPRWRKPTTLIVDGTVRSGAEVFVHALARAGFRLVGSRTAGAVTAGRPFLLSDGSFLIVATHRVTVDGENLEGVGIEPTATVRRTVPYCAGFDPVLDFALNE